MPRHGKTLPIVGQPASNSAIGLATQLNKDCLHYDIEWFEPREAIDAEVSKLVNGSAAAVAAAARSPAATAAALRNPKRWRNSMSSGYSSHSPPLSSYSTCCASVLKNSSTATLGEVAAAVGSGVGCGVGGCGGGGGGTLPLGLAVIHEAETIPRPIWPCTGTTVDSRELHIVGCETLDCEGLSASCYTHAAYTYASLGCRNDCHHQQQQQQHHHHHQPVPTARDVLLELSRTLNSVIDGESGMTPEEILRDISRTVTQRIDSGTTISTGRISSSSSGDNSALALESVNPVNLKLYNKGCCSSLTPAFKSSYQCTHEGKKLLLHQSVVKSEDERGKQLQQIPAVFLVPRCNGIYPQTLMNYGAKRVKGNNTGGTVGDDGRLIADGRNDFGEKCKRSIARLEGTSEEPVYSTQLDPSDESSSYAAVGKGPIKTVEWDQGIFNKSLDFTLDGVRAERLGRTIARAKRRRQWCRALTTLFGLVFFVLSVVIVSMSVTRGRKIFGKKIIHYIMVCVPCVFIPILLLFWRFLIQPLVMKLWQLRGKRKDTAEEGPPQLVKKCENGVCSMAWERSQNSTKVE